MNFKRLLKPILVILAILLLTLSVSAMTGSGTEGDPYIIYNATDLKNVENDMAAYYELANDIDLGGGNFEPIGYAAGSGYTAFTGRFDGKGHKIFNGYISYPDDSYIGIFARGDRPFIIQNVGVEITSVTGYDYVGGLIGYSYTGDGILNCFSTCNATGNDCVGSLAGYINTKVEKSYATGNVSGNTNVGGLVGSHRNSIIRNCYATGNVSGNTNVGGLAGYENDPNTFAYNYSTGKPTGTTNVGGLVGYARDIFSTPIANFWDTDTSETTTSAIGTGKTTTQMKDISTFSAWDIVVIGSYVDEDWFIDDGNDYPKLGWEYGEDDIDIGMEAIDRSSYAASGTTINSGNPANASGKITSVEIYAYSDDLEECKVATFYETDTNKLSTRDYEAIGTVKGGSKQTFTVDLDVEAGDYLGIYYSDGAIERDNSGDGYWYKVGADHIPCTEQAFSFLSNRTISLYGTGTTSDDETPNIFFIFSNF